MNEHEHETVAALIERAYYEALSSDERARLRQELDDCEACRRYYDEIAELDRTITERAPSLAPVSVDRVWSGIEFDLAREGKSARSWNTSLPWFIPGVAAVAGLLVFATAAPEFQTRGGEASVGDFGLTAFVIEPETQTVRRGPQGTVRLESGQLVQLALTARRAGQLGIVGVDAQGDLHWYQDERDPGAPFVATGSEVEEPVGPAWRIRAEDSPVSVWLIERAANVALGTDTLRGLDFSNPALVLEAE